MFNRDNVNRNPFTVFKKGPYEDWFKPDGGKFTFQFIIGDIERNTFNSNSLGFIDSQKEMCENLPGFDLV